MRFLSMIRVNENTGQVPSEQLMADMGKLIEEMTHTGPAHQHGRPAADRGMEIFTRTNTRDAPGFRRVRQVSEISLSVLPCRPSRPRP